MCCLMVSRMWYWFPMNAEGGRRVGTTGGTGKGSAMGDVRQGETTTRGGMAGGAG